MGKTRGVHETTPELRNRMVGMYEAGLGLRDIAVAVNCSQRTVKRWLNRFDKEGTVETRDRCGRKRATTSEQDEAIIRLATQTPITAAKAVLPALGLTCSVDTIRERLHKAGIHNWSPSRKHMQTIPLGDGDGTTIQQAVWRPTGTQLGKKKLSTKEKSPAVAAKVIKKTSSSGGKNTKKRSRKVRARDVYVGDGAPAELFKRPAVELVYEPPPPLPPSAPQVNDDMQLVNDALRNNISNQTHFGNDLEIIEQPSQAQIYQQQPGLNVTQNWPLDLVQGSHHYQQGETHSMSHPHPHLPHHHQHQQLEELHTQQEQEHQQRLLEQQQALHHHHQQQHQQQQHQLQQQQQTTSLQEEECEILYEGRLPIPDCDKRRSMSCSSSANSNDQLSEADDVSKDGSINDSDRHDDNELNKFNKNSKKGGKAKGTLETSLEIRNRMIGMSEAGLSTLSIALAINRSERTVKRWLERWNKEGNVQTKERKGRRRITTKEQDEAIIAMATQQPLTAAKHVAPALGLNCSVDTIRERLHKAGIHSWKLGKKQGEGNAVHTVHLWQPSGNRPNKPKLPTEKKNKSSSSSSIRKKRISPSVNSPPQRIRFTSRKNKTIESKIVQPPPASIVPAVQQQQQHQEFHDGQDMPPPPGAAAGGMLPAIMQQRPDCRMASGSVAPVAYPSSCMVNNHATSHIEQPDPLNYEPYIWSF